MREILKEVTRDALQVVRPPDRVPDVASGAMIREAAIAQTVVGSQKIWVGYVELPPGMVSAVHHHGEAESAIYVVSGHARFYAGAQLDTEDEAEAGDFVWVPPQLIHVEGVRPPSANSAASAPPAVSAVHSPHTLSRRSDC